MLTDLIVLMPLKIKELRKAPEPGFYLSFLQAISAFYLTNGEKSLHDEFWQAELNENQLGLNILRFFEKLVFAITSRILRVLMEYIQSGL